MSGQQQNIRHREPPSQTRTIQSPKDGDSSTSGDELSTRIVQISLLTNLGLAGIKLVGGWIFKSKSLSADGWHSLTDLATDVLALATILVSSMLKAIDLRKSTVGHVERSMSLLASGLLVMLGVHMAWESGTALGTQLIGRPAHVDSVPLDLDNDTQSMQAMWVAVLTILVKEWLYHASKWHIGL